MIGIQEYLFVCVMKIRSMFLSEIWSIQQLITAYRTLRLCKCLYCYVYNL